MCIRDSPKSTLTTVPSSASLTEVTSTESSTISTTTSSASLSDITTASNETCEVIYEYTDDDEYYSTVEISGTESVDAATTYTKTRIVYTTVLS